MVFDTTLALAAIIGYFVGSLPFGYLVAKANGVDIFSVGSCSPGATNVKRSVGPKAGNIVFLLDYLKGLVAAGWLLFMPDKENAVMVYSLIGLVAAVLGHSFSIFTKFRGGKGVATMLGGVTALMYVAAAVGIVLWLIVFYSTRYVSVASILMAASLPLTNYIVGVPVVLFWFSIAIAVVIIVRHKSNIVRLMKGEENRFERKSKSN
ncbi:glycerol-3-phosphate 1-O-acyltransferase PlsY [Puniceicoccaceae bacterium K14]|nr:glycerol-3-phosphate 1-O-acyltransferase PlsY [Puniceicoccaceae bacterium K14]